MLTFCERSNFACSQVAAIGDGVYCVTGHIAGELFGAGGLGHEFRGPGALERARRCAISIAYGKRMPELGASSGETLSGLQAVLIELGKAA